MALNSDTPLTAPLPAAIALSLARVCELVDMMAGHLNAARGPGVPDYTSREITNAKTRLCALRAECNSMKATLAATDLELHLVNTGVREHERMLESLHRAGDHTLDDETEGRAA